MANPTTNTPTTTNPLATAGQALSYLTWAPGPCMVRGTQTGAGQQSLQLIATLVATAFTALGLAVLFKPTAFQGLADKLKLSSDGMQKFGAIMALLGASGASWSTQNHVQIYRDRRAERKAKEQEGQISDKTVQAVKAQMAEQAPDVDLMVSMLGNKAQSETPAFSKADASKLVNALTPCLPSAMNEDGSLNLEHPIVEAAQGIQQLLEEGKGEKVLNKAGDILGAGKDLVSNLLHIGDSKDKGKSKKSKDPKIKKVKTKAPEVSKGKTPAAGLHKTGKSKHNKS